MDADSYIQHIDEQLRAYGFNREEEASDQDTTIVFFRTTDGVAPKLTRHEVVVVEQLTNYNVDAIETAIETGRSVYAKLDVPVKSRFDSEHCYLLLVAEEVTKPMRIRAERAAGEHPADENDAFLLPILVDLSETQLQYDDPSTLRRVTTHGTMATNVEKYFRL